MKSERCRFAIHQGPDGRWWIKCLRGPYYLHNVEQDRAAALRYIERVGGEFVGETHPLPAGTRGATLDAIGTQANQQ